MKALNRNQHFPLGCPMRGLHATILCPLVLLALSGCMRTVGPVASAQPQSDLEAMAYASAASPTVHDTAYRLDAGDKLRVVVYGQEGLTNTYAIDGGGSITMPLIRAVSAGR